MIRDKINKILSVKILNIHKAAYVLALANFITLALALLRDRLFVQVVGTGPELDAYFAAFKLPDLFFALLASFVSAFVFIPLYSREKNKDLFFSSSFFFYIISALFVSILAFIFTPFYLKTFFPTLFASVNVSDFIFLQRILLLQFIFMGLSSLFNSFVQMQHKFVAYSVAPIIYNLSIVSALPFYSEYGLKALGLFVVLGSFAHLFVNFYFAKSILPPLRLQVNYRLVFNLIAKALPRNLSLFVSQLIILISSIFLSNIQSGALSQFQLAFNLQSAPLAIVAVSYSVATFPSLTKHFSENNFYEYYKLISNALKHIFLWIFFISASIIVLRAHIVRLIFGTDNFTWQDTKSVSLFLAFFAISFVFQAVNLLFVRALYARSDTYKVLKISLVSLLVFVLSLLVLSFGESALKRLLYFLRFDDAWSLAIVPLAFLLSNLSSTLMFVHEFNKNILQKIKSRISNTGVYKSMLQTLIAGILSAILMKLLLNMSSHFIASLDSFFKVLIHASIAFFPSFGFYIFILNKMGNLELQEALRILIKQCKNK